MGKLDDQVVTALYGAIDSEARWVELMDLLRQRLGVESVAAQLLVASRDSVVPMWGTRDSVSERHAVLHDSWANSLANPRFRRPPLARRELEIGSDQRATHFSVQERGQLRDGLARCGLGPAFWISQQIDQNSRFTMIFHRPPDDGRDLETREQNLLETLAPHFRQAIGLWVRLAKAEARASLAEQVGNAMPAAAVACDRQLRVHWINADAQRLFLLGGGIGGRGSQAGGGQHHEIRKASTRIHHMGALMPTSQVGYTGLGGKRQKPVAAPTRLPSPSRGRKMLWRGPRQ